MKHFTWSISKSSIYVMKAFAFCLVLFVFGCGNKSSVSFPKYSVDLYNVPTKVSSDTVLNVSVQGQIVAFYRYKMGPASTTSCADEKGYSTTLYPATTPISDDLSAYPDQKMVLCVLGIDNYGVQALYKDAISTEWYLDRVPALVNLTEYEQKVSESNVSNQIITATISVAKSYPVSVSYTSIGDATYMIDHNLPTSGVITIPAGATSGTLSFQILRNSAKLKNSYLLVKLLKTDASINAIGPNYNSSVFIKDVDGGAKPTVSSMSFDGNTMCAITSDGVLRCWGRNDYGQVGAGTDHFVTTPTEVDPGVHYLKVSNGSLSTCGITTTNVLKCWGRNNTGQLGLGNLADTTTPTVVNAGVSYSSVVTSGGTTCGLTTGGLVRCWGSNAYGQIGDNTTVDKSLPVAIDGAVVYSEIVTNNGTTCGRTSANALKCWGLNTSGQVGNSTTTNRLTPYAVDSTLFYSQISLSSSTVCGITTTNILKCWGYNSVGQVGDNTTANKTAPTVIDTGVSYSQVRTLGNGTCGITTGNILKCWGANDNYQLGDGTNVNKKVPTVIDSGTSYSFINIQTTAKCGITTANVLKCWGLNSTGELADGTGSSRSSPVVIDPGVSYSSVIGYSGFTTCGITTTGEGKCWGTNTYGGIGDGSIRAVFLPKAVDSDRYTAFSMSNGSTCAVTTSGDLKCWGIGNFGQQGDGTIGITRATPHIVDPGVKYKFVSSNIITCAITVDGTLKCWGTNTYGNVGDGTTVNKLTPTVIDKGTKYTYVSAMVNDFTCGLTTDQVLKCWGNNSTGQLGDGTYTSRYTPVVMDNGVKYSSFTSAYGTVCGITAADGTLKCWGANYYGQAGDGTGLNYNVPRVIDAANKYQMVNTDTNTTCGITTGRVLKCWGYNVLGQIGDGTTSNRISPIVIDSGVSYSLIGLHFYTACGITYPGNSMKCWGLNGAGQVPDGTTTNRSVPTLVDSSTTYQSIAGNFNYCGITTGNALKCWGENTYGQTGNNMATNTLVPVVIDPGVTYQSVQTASNSACGLTTGGILKCWGRDHVNQTGAGSDYFRNLPRSIMTWLAP